VLTQECSSLTFASAGGAVPVTLDPAARTLRARIGAFAQHSKHPIEATTRAGLDAANSRFERLVDPDGTLSEAERTRRAAAARRAHMLQLSFRARKGRQAADTSGEAV
jgi:hypothetical protein